MAPGADLRLLDLPPDLLARIGAQLPFVERLQLALVCRRWRDVCAGPSQLWQTVDASIRSSIGNPDVDLEFNPCIPDFVRQALKWGPWCMDDAAVPLRMGSLCVPPV